MATNASSREYHPYHPIIWWRYCCAQSDRLQCFSCSSSCHPHHHGLEQDITLRAQFSSWNTALFEDSYSLLSPSDTTSSQTISSYIPCIDSKTVLPIHTFHCMCHLLTWRSIYYVQTPYCILYRHRHIYGVIFRSVLTVAVYLTMRWVYRGSHFAACNFIIWYWTWCCSSATLPTNEDWVQPWPTEKTILWCIYWCLPASNNL
jgi:hypothetical protein